MMNSLVRTTLHNSDVLVTSSKMSPPPASTSTSTTASATSSSSSAAPLFKKKRSRPGTSSATTSGHTNGTASSSSSSSSTRRGLIDDVEDDERKASGGRGKQGEDDDEEPISVVHKSRRVGPSSSNPLLQSTGLSLAKRKRLEAAASSAGDDKDGEGDEDDYSTVTSRVKAGSSSTANGSRSNREDATRGVEWYDEDDDHGKTSSSKQSHPQTLNGDEALEASSSNVNPNDGIYRGLSSYTNTSNASTSKSKSHSRGPLPAPSHLRTVTVVDYQPDVCKDYKQTGYCGFGDTCKFLHDRGDYLKGWQMEDSFLQNSNARHLDLDLDDGDDDDDDDDHSGLKAYKAKASNEADEDEDDKIPFACLLCRQPFTDPIVTRCGHYFCSPCAIKRFTKTPKCFACGKQTGGIFNSATKVIDKMNRLRQHSRTQQQEGESKSAWGAVGADNGNDEEGVAEAEGTKGEILDGVTVEGA